MKKVLTIAGSDPSGGAGIQVDLKTFALLGVQGLSAVTAITAQNEKRFFSVNPVSARLLREQLQSITDAHTIDAIKIGMLGTEENVIAVSRFLEKNEVPWVVLDPVIKASTGAVLLEPKGVAVLKEILVPLVTIVTPNIEEAETMTRSRIKNVDDMKKAARDLFKSGRQLKAVLIKGGHLQKRVEKQAEEQSTDVLYDGQEFHVFSTEKEPADVHGTGCALSAAMAAYLALGFFLEKSVDRAKAYVLEYIKRSIWNMPGSVLR